MSQEIGVANPRTASAEQQLIINESNPYFVVLAGAGSGKTWVLVERYIKAVLEDGILPSQLLTVTFTVKAASEMRARIIQAFNVANRSDLAQGAESGPIGTIHSLCERILRENAISAGMDPEFEILPNGDSNQWLRKAALETIAEFEQVGGATYEFIENAVGKTDWRRVGPYENFINQICATLSTIRGSGVSRAEFADNHESEECLFEQWKRRWIHFLPEESQNQLLAVSDPQQFIETFRIETKGVPELKEVAEPKFENEMEALRLAVGYAPLISETWRRYEFRMLGEQRLDFSELERQAVKLIEQSPEVRLKLKNQFRRLMIDESQDLNPVQYRLLDNLEYESVLLVGDPKQSIFGFRHAKPELFIDKSNSNHRLTLVRNFRSETPILSAVDSVFTQFWKESYDPALKPDVFDLESDLPQRPFTDPKVELWRYRSGEEKGRKQFQFVGEKVRDLINAGEQPKNIAILIRQWGMGKSLLEYFTADGVPARMVGGKNGLFPRMEARDIANILSALSDPLDDFSLLAVLRGPLCGISFDAITLLAREGFVRDALTEFESPVDSDLEKILQFIKWFFPLCEVADRMPAWEVLGLLINEAGLLEAFSKRPRGEEMVANVRKLVRIASKMPELGPFEFSKQIRDIQKVDHEITDADIVNEDSDVVTITTIHRAKGLEWPVVVIVDDVKPYVNRNEILIDPNLGFVVPSLSGNRRSILRDILKSQSEGEAREESKRLLYVAMTRAKRQLFITLAEESGKPMSFTKDLIQVPDVATALRRQEQGG